MIIRELNQQNMNTYRQTNLDGCSKRYFILICWLGGAVSVREVLCAAGGSVVRLYPAGGRGQQRRAGGGGGLRGRDAIPQDGVLGLHREPRGYQVQAHRVYTECGQTESRTCQRKTFAMINSAREVFELKLLLLSPGLKVKLLSW